MNGKRQIKTNTKSILRTYIMTTQRDGMGREEDSGWGTRVYLWQIHVDIWQNKYNIVKLKKKKKKENCVNF